MRFEKHCWAEIDLDALLSNYTLIRRTVGGNVCAVLKADAYGHGSVAVAEALHKAGVAAFAVSCLAEARHLRRHGLTEPLLILGYTDPAFADELASLGITQALFSPEYAAELSRGMGDAPDWFQSGINAVVRAPSAMNRQAYRFTYSNGTVTVQQTEHTTYSDVDLGIAKLQFEIGAHGGTWTWGDGGTFTKAKEEKSCGAVIWRRTERGHEFLLAQHGASHWSFPKGHIEEGETAQETAIREIGEEAGVHQLEPVCWLGKIHFRYRRENILVLMSTQIYLFKALGDTNDIQKEDWMNGIKWFSYDKAVDIIAYRDIAKLIRLGRRRLEQRGEIESRDERY